MRQVPSEAWKDKVVSTPESGSVTPFTEKMVGANILTPQIKEPITETRADIEGIFPQEDGKSEPPTDCLAINSLEELFVYHPELEGHEFVLAMENSDGKNIITLGDGSRAEDHEILDLYREVLAMGQTGQSAIRGRFGSYMKLEGIESDLKKIAFKPNYRKFLLHNPEGKLIGLAESSGAASENELQGLNDEFPVSLPTPIGEVAYFVHPEYLRKGHAKFLTMTAFHFLQFLGSQLSGVRIIIDHDNRASLEVAKRIMKIYQEHGISAQGIRGKDWQRWMYFFTFPPAPIQQRMI